MKFRSILFELTLLLVSIFLVFAYGCGNKVQRYGSVIGIPKENIPEYKELHANCAEKKSFLQ